MGYREVVTKFKTRARSVLGDNLVSVYWFGSTAGKNAHSGSDVDLLVETRSPVNTSQRDQMADIAIDLCAESDTMLDIHYYTTEEMNKRPFSHSPFVETIKGEAVNV